jgi:hypothetical protein
MKEELCSKVGCKKPRGQSVAAREKCSYEQRRKLQLTAVLTAIEKASERLSKDVNEVKCSVYECKLCAKNNAAKYTDDYNVFAVDCNGDKLATCLLCGKQNFISMFKRIGQITFADVKAKRKLLDEKKETKKKRKVVDAKVEPSTKKTKTERNGSGGVVSKQHDNCDVTVTSRDYSVGRGDGGGASMRSKVTVMAPPGMLGIILTNRNDSRGTVVSGVRTASVLATQVSPGDQIIAIDDEDVSQMNVKEITTIMTRKSGFTRVLTLLAARKTVCD